MNIIFDQRCGQSCAWSWIQIKMESQGHGKINNSNQNQWKGNTANDRQMETTEEKGNKVLILIVIDVV